MSGERVTSPKVFSAHAEVVPEAQIIEAITAGILRARGGSSYHAVVAGPTRWYSPRTRR